MTPFNLDFFRRMNEIASPPFQILKALDQAENMSAKNFNIIHAIQYDPAIACRILKIANMPLYGYPSRIMTLQQASGLLGPGSIKNIVLTTPILERFANHAAGDFSPDYASLWRHMAVTAVIAGGLASFLEYDEPDVLFTAGLIHDIGKIGLALHFPELLRESVERAKRENLSLSCAEIATFGFTHGSIAAEMVKAWSYPEALVNLLKNFSDPNLPKKNDKLAAMLYLAEYLANDWEYHDGLETNKTNLPEWLFTLLGITGEDLEKWRPELKSTAEIQARQ